MLLNTMKQSVIFLSLQQCFGTVIFPCKYYEIPVPLVSYKSFGQTPVFLQAIRIRPTIYLPSNVVFNVPFDSYLYFHHADIS